MIDQDTLKYLVYFAMAMAGAVAFLMWSYAVGYAVKMFKNVKQNKPNDPLENVKFSAVSSLTHIALVGGFVVITVLISTYVYSARDIKINNEELSGLKDLIIQILMLIGNIISAFIGYFVRGEAEKIKENGKITSNTRPDISGQGNPSSSNSSFGTDLH